MTYDYDTCLPVPEFEDCFSSICEDIRTCGYSIQRRAVPEDLLSDLCASIRHVPEDKYQEAGIGRDGSYEHNQFIRKDKICWITGTTEAGKRWLDWSDILRQYLNRELLLGLFSFESHFAHYPPGAFYKRHYDAFRGESNRVLSMVLYLNYGWRRSDGGELVIYQNCGHNEDFSVLPEYGTAVFFLSEDIPHEVLATRRSRFSIAGWFRVNNSTANRVDPPM